MLHWQYEVFRTLSKVLGLRVYLIPVKAGLFKDLYKEIMKRSRQ